MFRVFGCFVALHQLTLSASPAVCFDVELTIVNNLQRQIINKEDQRFGILKSEKDEVLYNLVVEDWSIDSA